MKFDEYMRDQVAKLTELELAPQRTLVSRRPGVVEGMWMDEVAHYFAPATPAPSTEVTLAEVVRKAYELESAPKPPEKIKLTSGEWDQARACASDPPAWGPDRSAAWVWGVPVELVDDPEESDLRRHLRRERLGFWTGESEVR